MGIRTPTPRHTVRVERARMRVAGSDGPEHMRVRDPARCELWLERSITRLSAVIVAPTPGRAVARDRARVRRAGGHCDERHFNANGSRCRRAVGRNTELSVVIAAPADGFAVGANETAMGAAGDDAELWLQRSRPTPHGILRRIGRGVFLGANRADGDAKPRDRRW